MVLIIGAQVGEEKTRFPSGVSHRGAPEPDVIARDRPSGVVNPTNGETVRLSTSGISRSKRSLTNM